MVILYPAVGTLPKPINCAKTVIRKPPGSHRDRWSRAPAEEKGIALPTNPIKGLNERALEAGLGGDDGLRVGRPVVHVSLAFAPHSERARQPDSSAHSGSGTARAGSDGGKGPRDANSGSGAVASQSTQGRKEKRTLCTAKGVPTCLLPTGARSISTRPPCGRV